MIINFQSHGGLSLSLYPHLHPAVLGLSNTFQYKVKQPAKTRKCPAFFLISQLKQWHLKALRVEEREAEIISSGEIFHFLAVIFGVKPGAQSHFCGFKIGFWQHLTMIQNIKVYYY